MKVTPSTISDVLIIEPDVYGDNRGYFFESWNHQKYSQLGITSNFIQDNESCSKFGVLRGLHYQAAPYTQAKLIRVISGTVLDIAVDIRKGSPTFGQHVAIEISGENKRQVFIPRGFAHGFIVLSNQVIFNYKCDNYYMPSSERGIAFNDPTLNINWPIDIKDCILSEKDLKNPLFKDASVFDYNAQDYLK
jgi:dTDP-4-dehydrorhamnose 3,5-epimerase